MERAKSACGSLLGKRSQTVSDAKPWRLCAGGVDECLCCGEEGVGVSCGELVEWPLQHAREGEAQRATRECHGEGYWPRSADRRSADSTRLRKRRAIVVGSTPPTRGVILPATASQASLTSGRSFRPS